LLIYICAIQYSEYINSTVDRRIVAYLHEKWASNILNEVKDEVNVLKDEEELETTSSKISEFQYPNYTQKELDKIKESNECHKPNVSLADMKLIEDIDVSPPKPNKAIFFINTSCIRNYRVTLNARQTCAIESAARMNPNRDVFVLFASPVGFKTNGEDPPMIAELKSYPNVYFRHVNIREFSKNTPAEEWIKKDRIQTSPFFIYHLSDYIRLLALYKFGGSYFDFDLIFFKSLDNLPPNYVTQSKTGDDYIENAVLNFESTGPGHKMVEMIIRECIGKYNGNAFDYNGPKAVLRAVKTICKTNNVAQTSPEKCWGLKVLPDNVFFPLVPFEQAFQNKPENYKKVMQKLKDNSIGFHYWSSQTKAIHILKTDKPSAFTTYAQKVCPKAYGNSGTHFDK